MSSCLQISVREKTGTRTLTAIARQTFHYTVQHGFHHSQKSSYSRAIYPTRCWSAAAAPRHTETLKDWYQSALTTDLLDNITSEIYSYFGPGNDVVMSSILHILPALLILLVKESPVKPFCSTLKITSHQLRFNAVQDLSSGAAEALTESYH